MKFIRIVSGLILFVAAINAQQKLTTLNTSPEKAKLVVSDIDNFWRAYDLAQKETSRAKRIEIYQHEYFDKGSTGLKDFIELRIESAENLVANIDSMPKYYASVRESSLQISKMRPQILKSFKELKKIYPNAVFPDVYFLIGIANSGGTLSENGLYIGSEMYGLTSVTPKEELGKWLNDVLKPIAYIPGVVAHELIHYQQNFSPNNTLLGQSLEEGTADFFGQMISHRNINEHIYEYGHSHEKALWNEFTSEMETENFNKWLFNGDSSNDRPADLGYFVGFKISEAYYKKAKNKKQAVADILNIKNAKEFLRQSGYDPSGN